MSSGEQWTVKVLDLVLEATNWQVRRRERVVTAWTTPVFGRGAYLIASPGRHAVSARPREQGQPEPPWTDLPGQQGHVAPV